MLNHPYRKFHYTDYNNYYILRGQDKFYLAIESVVPLANVDGGFDDLQQGLKLIPLTVPLMMLLKDIADLKVDRRDKDSGNIIYTPFDHEGLLTKIKDVQEVAREMNILGTEETKYETFPRFSEDDNTSNTIIHALETSKQGYNRLYSEGAPNLVIHGRLTWMYKVTSLGSVILLELTTVGLNDPYNSVVAMNTHALNRTIAIKALKMIDQIEQKNKTVEETKIND